jgi:hypothetical protein
MTTLATTFNAKLRKEYGRIEEGLSKCQIKVTSVRRKKS